jgi:hypothetical protein
MIRFQAPRVTILSALLSIAASTASAETYTPALSCRSVEAIVARSGAATLYTGAGEYDRYVSDQSRCQRDEQARPGYARTADSASCFVGYTCEYVYPNGRR